LIGWNFLLQASLNEVKELLKAGYNSNEGLYEANKERIDCLSKKHSAICYGVYLIMAHLGLQIVHTPSKDEVVAIEKEQSCKKEG